MKTIYFILTFLIFFSIASFAATATWMGGNGNWDIAANWSTGSIPTANDDAVINAGIATIPNGFNAVTASVNIGILGSLELENNSSLAISNASVSSFINNGNCENNGTITIELSSAFGLYNDAQGIFENNGDILIDDSYDGGLFNLGEFINDGLLEISNGSGPFSEGLANNGIFENLLYSRVDIDNVLSNGITNLAGVSFQNEGIINIDNAGSFGLSNVGTFYNLETGVIEVHNSVHNNLHLLGSFNNDGRLVLGLSVADGSMNNQGGTFMNEFCGELIVHDHIHNQAGSTFTNRGWLVNEYTGSHANTGTMKNKWVLEDNHGAFIGAILNRKVVAKSVAGPLTVGVAEFDILGLHNNTLGSVVVTGWYTDETLSTFAGSYYVPSNYFIPYAASVGLTRLFVRFSGTQNGEYCTYVMKVDIPGGIQNPPGPLVQQGNDIILNPRGSNDFNEEPFVYPSPSKGVLNIEIPESQSEVSHAHLLSLNGQVITSFSNLSGKYAQLEFASHISNGLYFLKIHQNNGTTNLTKVLIER